SSDAVEHARNRYAHPNVTFEHYDGRSLPLADASIDLATCFQVIEHVGDAAALVREISRVLRPSGTALITTPNRVRRLKAGERPWHRYHVHEFDASELSAVLCRSFAEVEVFGIRGSPAMEQIERSRVARARRLAKLDPLGLRYVLPERLDTRL